MYNTKKKGAVGKNSWLFLLETIKNCIWIENIRNNFFHKNTVAESETPSQLQKEKRGSAKSDVSKVLFLDIGKIPVTGNNATLKIDFTDLRK